MRKLSRKWKLWGLFFVLMFFAAGATVHTTATDVQAATKNGFKTEKGKSYYYQNGQKVKGWLTLNGKKYFFNKSTGVQMKRWAKDSKGKRYFYNVNGAFSSEYLRIEPSFRISHFPLDIKYRHIHLYPSEKFPHLFI